MKTLNKSFLIIILFAWSVQKFVVGIDFTGPWSLNA